MADPVAVAQAFVQHFNSLFDSADRTALAPLYVRLPPPAPAPALCLCLCRPVPRRSPRH